LDAALAFSVRTVFAPEACITVVARLEVHGSFAIQGRQSHTVLAGLAALVADDAPAHLATERARLSARGSEFGAERHAPTTIAHVREASLTVDSSCTVPREFGSSIYCATTRPRRGGPTTPREKESPRPPTEHALDARRSLC
jgi:hypothetical protein